MLPWWCHFDSTIQHPSAIDENNHPEYLNTVDMEKKNPQTWNNISMTNQQQLVFHMVCISQISTGRAKQGKQSLANAERPKAVGCSLKCDSSQLVERQPRMKRRPGCFIAGVPIKYIVCLLFGAYFRD